MSSAETFNAYRYSLPRQSKHDKVATFKEQGRSLDEIVAAKPTAAYDAKWGGGLMSAAVFTGLVYQRL